MGLRGIIFDVDGTLVDSVDLHAAAWQEALRHWGREVPYPEVRQQIGKGGDRIVPEFFPPQEAKRIGDELRRWRLELFQRRYMPLVKPFPKVRELVQRCQRAGLKIGIATSAQRQELQQYLRLAHIADLLDAATNADDVESSKPAPDVFQAALAKLRLPPEQVLVVGDTPYDAEAAGKLGLRTLGVLCGGFPAAQLRAAGCIQIYRDPEDLLNRFEEWAAGSPQNKRAA